MRLCSYAVKQLGGYVVWAVIQLCSYAIMQLGSYAVKQLSSYAVM